MYRIGIDVGSAYTKYCVMKDGEIVTLFSEKTPIRQRVYFEEKVKELHSLYPDAEIVSCGYGKANVDGIHNINELTALAKGVFYTTGENGIVLDIGGQDTKIIVQEDGQLKEFFVNDKCAAGSGMFLSSVLEMINVRFDDIDLSKRRCSNTCLSTTCAVFAQSEIVELIADNKDEEEILSAVISQILIKAKPLIRKVYEGNIIFSGGISQIKGIEDMVEEVLSVKCIKLGNSNYLSAIGCATVSSI